MILPADPLWLAGFALGLAGTGLFAGVIAGLLGVGGGIVIVPVLFHVFTALGIDEAVRMHLAVGTSLATIVPTSIASARAHLGRGSVDLALLRLWGPFVFAGAILGVVLAGLAKGDVLTAVFATVALAVSANMALRPEGSALAPSLPAPGRQRLLATTVGAFSAVMGIGGGTLTVPILTAYNYPIRRAVGTAAAIGFEIAVPGVVGFILAGWNAAALPPGSLGYVNLIGFVLIFPATMVMAPVGARLAHTVSTGGLRKAFAAFLFLTAARMLYSLT